MESQPQPHRTNYIVHMGAMNVRLQDVTQEDVETFLQPSIEKIESNPQAIRLTMRFFLEVGHNNLCKQYDWDDKTFKETSDFIP